MNGVIDGRSVLITGATGGIGFLAAGALARAGARLYMQGRTPEKVEHCARELSRSGVLVEQGFVADLASLEQTASLARQIARDVPALDVLVNNAGVGFGSDRRRRELSRDGLELRFAVNYLAPYLLTELLAEQGCPGRAVINVASIGQEALDFSDLMLERQYEGTLAYRRSKLALIVWTFEFAERHPNLVAVALHPGTLLDTTMVRQSGIPPRGPASRGAEVICGVVERALSDRQSGLYYDELTPARAKPQAYDAAARRQLREASLELTRPFRGG